MIDAPILLAFTAGMVATVNPCGFAMLPAYLSFFLGDEELSPSRSEAVAKAIGVGAAVSGGFLLVFGIAGAALHLRLAVDRQVVAVAHARHRRRAGGPRHRDARRLRAGGSPPQAEQGWQGAQYAVDVRVRHLLRHRLDLLHAPDLHRHGDLDLQPLELPVGAHRVPRLLDRYGAGPGGAHRLAGPRQVGFRRRTPPGPALHQPSQRGAGDPRRSLHRVLLVVRDPGDPVRQPRCQRRTGRRGHRLVRQHQPVGRTRPEPPRSDSSSP